VTPNLTFTDVQGLDSGDLSESDVFVPSKLSDVKYLNFAVLARILSCGHEYLEDQYKSFDIPKEFFTEQILNSGNLSERSNCSIFNLGDMIRTDALGTTKLDFSVNAADFAPNTEPTTDSDGLARLSPRTPVGVHYLYHTAGKMHATPLLNDVWSSDARSTSGIFDAIQILGLNWPKWGNGDPRIGLPPKEKSHSYSDSTKTGGISKYGPINFHSVFPRQDYETDCGGVYSDLKYTERNREYDIQYDENAYFQLNHSKSRRILTILDSSDTRNHFVDWLNNSVFDNENNPPSGDLTSIGRESNFVVNSGILGGHLGLQHRFEGRDGHESAPQLFDFVQTSIGDLRSPSNPALMLSVPLGGAGAFGDTLRGPISWDAHEWFYESSSGSGVYNQDRVDKSEWDSGEWGSGDDTPCPTYWIIEKFSIAAVKDWNWVRENRYRGSWIFPLRWKYITSYDSHPSDFDDIIYKPDRINVDNDNMSMEDWITYFKMKGGGAIRLWGTLEGIYKRLYRRSVEILLESVNAMSEGEVSFDAFNNYMMDNDTNMVFLNSWVDCIQSLFTQDGSGFFEALSLDSNWLLRVNHDGKIVLWDKSDLGNDRNLGRKSTLYSNYQREHEGSVSENNSSLVKEYGKFKALLSDVSVFEITDNTTKEIRWNTLFPVEILRTSSNRNYANGHGNAMMYTPVYSPTVIEDPLKVNLETARGLGRATYEDNTLTPFGPVGAYAKQNFLKQHGPFVLVSNFLKNIRNPIDQFGLYVEDLVIDEDVKSPYQEGLISFEDITKASKILPLIDSNLSKYKADEHGIGEFWKDLATNKTLKSSVFDGTFVSDNNIFLAFVGINEDFVQYTLQEESGVPFYIDVDFHTDGWATVDFQTQGWNLVGSESIYGVMMPNFNYDSDGLADVGQSWERKVIRIQNGIVDIVDLDLEESSNPETTTVDGVNEKERLFDALHGWTQMIKGFRLDPSVFVENYEQIYSEFLQNNEVGVFPWSSADFENGKPKIELESIYNVSPWLFPKNFFMEVVKPREFRHVVPVFVKVPPDSNGSNMFQGNIKFKIYKES